MYLISSNIRIRLNYIFCILIVFFSDPSKFTINIQKQQENDYKSQH